MASKITKGIIISFWVLFAIAVGVIVLLFLAIAKGSIGYMPPVEQLENPIDKYASQVVSSDGKTLERMPIVRIIVFLSIITTCLRIW